MKTMTLSIVAALALGCASKPVEDLPTEDLDTTSNSGDEEEEEEDEDDDDVDDDGDGITIADGDCNDNDDAIYPGAEEACNGVDDDCDDNIDEGLPTTRYYADADDDGFGNPDVRIDACEQPDDYVADNTDCNDAERTANPEGVEVSNNSIDENCDGFDIDGKDCAGDALDLTMEWIEYWTWALDDSAGTVDIPGLDILGGLVTGNYEMTDKLLNVDPVSSTATTAAGEALKVDVEIETELMVETHMTASAPLGLLAQDCLLIVGPVPVLYSGQIELDIDGNVISGEANLSHTILSEGAYSAEPYPGSDGSCNFDTIDTLLEYTGYGSVDDFIMDDINEVATTLEEQIEDDLKEFDIPAACNPE